LQADIRQFKKMAGQDCPVVDKLAGTLQRVKERKASKKQEDQKPFWMLFQEEGKGEDLLVKAEREARQMNTDFDGQIAQEQKTFEENLQKISQERLRDLQVYDRIKQKERLCLALMAVSLGVAFLPSSILPSLRFWSR
jgi:hypothetical protein